MKKHPLEVILKLNDNQIKSIQAIETHYDELIDQLFASDLTMRQMMKQMRHFTQEKHSKICALLTAHQQQIYHDYNNNAHSRLKKLL
ncbi:hypothetical protein [Celerinatantimonas sp. YJH-8]|uniref:hypothetical protein n=1 Tax=Celerinatantimonas sp. YJH-8 TaxID=3228714 RepID=UPI0038CA6B06